MLEDWQETEVGNRWICLVKKRTWHEHVFAFELEFHTCSRFIKDSHFEKVVFNEVYLIAWLLKPAGGAKGYFVVVIGASDSLVEVTWLNSSGELHKISWRYIDEWRTWLNVNLSGLVQEALCAISGIITDSEVFALKGPSCGIDGLDHR